MLNQPREKSGFTLWNSHKVNSTGFTLIELIVALAIIGFLLTVTVWSISAMRLRARDSKRVANIKEIQKALELYYADQRGYPVTGGSLVVGGPLAQTLSSVGFTAYGAGSGEVYVVRVPGNIVPGGANYLYTSNKADGSACTALLCDSYRITFKLENASGTLPEGSHTAKPGSIE